MAQQKKNTGSFGSQQSYDRLVSTFGPAATATAVATGEAKPPVSDAPPLVAADVFNKVALLAAIALVCGIGAAAVHVGGGVAFVAVIVAMGCGLVGLFRPAQAHVLAPLFAVFEGVALGWISRLFSEGNGEVVPLAIIGTTVIFFAVLGAYRTGLVKVGRNFAKATIIAGLGLIAMMIATMFGLTLPYTSQATTGLIVFGFLYLIVAVMDLFVDFSYVYRAQQAGVSKDGEWFAALSIMFSLVMVYLSLLRIFGSR